jgi:hypothetical protein
VTDTDFPEELNYVASVEANMMIARALGELAFMRRMETLMPLVAQRLAEAGVDFSKARFDDEPHAASVTGKDEE